MLGMLRSRLTSLKMNFNLVEIRIEKHIWLNDYYPFVTIRRNATDLLFANIQHHQNFDLKNNHLLVFKQ